MKNTDNTFFICERWMVDELGLKGIDLMLFALLYGFASGSTGSFWGSRDFLSQWVGCSTTSLIRHLTILESKGYIERKRSMENGRERVTYLVCRFPGDADEETAEAVNAADSVAGRIADDADESAAGDASGFPQTPSDLNRDGVQNGTEGGSKWYGRGFKMKPNNNNYNYYDNDMDNTAQGAGALRAGAQGARKRGRGKAAEDGGCGESERRTEGQGYVKGEGDARSAARRRGRYAGDRRRTDSDAAERRRGTISSFDTDDFFEAAVRRSFKNLEGD